jgi:hypothetical protein
MHACHIVLVLLRGYSFVLLKIEYEQNLMPTNEINNEEVPEEIVRSTCIRLLFD